MTTHKEFARHKKLFNQGMQQFNDGNPEPKENTPEWHGWKAAQEMKNVKSKWIVASRLESGFI